MDEIPETRDSLLIRVADARDQAAWEQFSRIYRPVVYNVARMRGLQDADAQDVAQQVLLSVSKALLTWQRLDESTRFRHWLCRMARNATINMLTRQPQDRAVGGQLLSVEIPEDPAVSDLDSRLVREYRRQLFRQAAEHVRTRADANTWQAFAMTMIDGLTITEAAERLQKSAAARRRFAREAKAAATVLHPNVIVIHGVSNDGALPFLVMPYLRGESLQRRLDRLGPLATEEILRIAQQVAAGLAAAHGQGLVHRDIKPANILLEDGVERVTLTDFGLARDVDDASMTRSGVIAGTPQYMSPEQARGDNVDARSDLFSLGSVMYAMCTGRPPFRAETSYGILRRITDTEPRPIREVNPNIPEWLDRTIQRLLAKSLEDRIPTADHVATLLQSCLAHLQQPAIVELPEECRVPQRTIKMPTKLMAVLAILVLFTLVMFISFASQEGSRGYFLEAGKSESGLNTASETRTPNDEAGSELMDAESALNWDAIQTDINAFENDLISSETDANKLWQTTPERNPP